MRLETEGLVRKGIGWDWRLGGCLLAEPCRFQTLSAQMRLGHGPNAPKCEVHPVLTEPGSVPGPCANTCCGLACTLHTCTPITRDVLLVPCRLTTAPYPMHVSVTWTPWRPALFPCASRAPPPPHTHTNHQPPTPVTSTLFPPPHTQGDQLIATSGVVYTRESDYGGATVKGGQQLVRMLVLGEVRRSVLAVHVKGVGKRARVADGAGAGAEGSECGWYCIWVGGRASAARGRDGGLVGGQAMPTPRCSSGHAVTLYSGGGGGGGCGGGDGGGGGGRLVRAAQRQHWDAQRPPSCSDRPASAAVGDGRGLLLPAGCNCPPAATARRLRLPAGCNCPPAATSSRSWNWLGRLLRVNGGRWNGGHGTAGQPVNSP